VPSPSSPGDLPERSVAEHTTCVFAGWGVPGTGVLAGVMTFRDEVWAGVVEVGSLWFVRSGAAYPRGPATSLNVPPRPVRAESARGWAGPERTRAGRILPPTPNQLPLLANEGGAVPFCVSLLAGGVVRIVQPFGSVGGCEYS